MQGQSETITWRLSDGLSAGAAVADITGCGAIALRGEPLSSCEIRHRLHARTLLFRAGEGEALWVNADECTFRRLHAIEIKRVIEAKTGILPERIMLTATHSHSGHSYESFLPAAFAESVAGAVEAARKVARPLRQVVERTGKAPKGSIINRRYSLGERLGDICVMHNIASDVDIEKMELDATRKVAEHLEVWGTTFEAEGIPSSGHILRGPVDDRLHLWTLLDNHGQPIASVARVNAHAVTVSQSKVGPIISADFVRPFGDTIEAVIKAPCLVLNGAEGNTRPLQKEYNFEECDRIGKSWARAALDAPARAFEAGSLVSVDQPRIEFDIRGDLPHDSTEMEKLRNRLKTEPPPVNTVERKKRFDMLMAVNKLIEPVPPKGGGMMLPGEVDSGRVTCEWQAWAVGPIRLVCAPGEPLVELCRDIERESGCLTVGLANGNIGYLPDAPSSLRGGYEAGGALGSGELSRLPALAARLAAALGRHV